MRGYIHTASRLSREVSPYAVFRATCAVTSPQWTEHGDDPDSWRAPHDAAGGLLLWTLDGDPLRAEPPSKYRSLDEVALEAYQAMLAAGAVRGIVVASYASSGGRMVALCHSGGEWWITVSREDPHPRVGSTEAVLRRADPDAVTYLMAATPVERPRPCLDCGQDDHPTDHYSCPERMRLEPDQD